MAVTSARRVPERRAGRDRVGGSANVIGSYWLAGKCTRNPCRFLHTSSAPLSQPPKQAQHRRANTCQRSLSNYVKNLPIPKSAGVKLGSNNFKKASASTTGKVRSKSGSIEMVQTMVCENWLSGDANKSSASTTDEVGLISKSTEKVQTKVCENWLSGNCVYGEKCQNLHSWCHGNGLSMLAKLDGHSKTVAGIALPSGSDKLYTCGQDNTVRVWDCHSGQCSDVINVPHNVGCLVSEGPWLFLGLENEVKVSNIQTLTQFTLTGPVGQVNSMVVNGDMFYAGTQDGTVLAWKFSSESSSPELVASLKGHNRAVISLMTGACGRLYSGSMDNTIRVWDINTFQCIQTLKGHTGAVMSLLCWDTYLLSCSLDGTVKAWAETESGKIEEVYTYEEEHGLLALCGLYDAERKPILLCSCNDNTVRLYDLPSFTERGRLFSKREVRSIETASGGLFFTGDATGQLTVWKLAGDFMSPAS